MEKVLINGEIYIKIKPHYIYPDNKKIQNIEQEIYNIEFEEADKGITEETQQEKELLLQLKKTLSKIVIDKRYMKEFHIIEISQDNIIMRSYNTLGQKQELKYRNIGDIKDEYIELSTFLKNAEYIGKEFIRTEPLMIEGIKDLSYTTEDPYASTTVLYKTDYGMLTRYKSCNSETIEMLEPNYFQDNKYKLIGNQIKQEEKQEIYKRIIDEITKRNILYKKYYKNKQI